MSKKQTLFKFNCLGSDVDTIEFELSNQALLKISAADNSEGLEQETLIYLDLPDVEKLINFLQNIKEEMK